MEKVKTMVVIKPEAYRHLLETSDFFTRSPIATYVQELQQLVPKILNSDKYSSVEKMARYRRLMKKLNDLAEAPYQEDIRALSIMGNTQAVPGSETQKAVKRPASPVVVTDVKRPASPVVQRKATMQTVQPETAESMVQTGQSVQTSVRPILAESTVQTEPLQQMLVESTVQTEPLETMSAESTVQTEHKSVGESTVQKEPIQQSSSKSIFRPAKLTAASRVKENWVPSPRLEGKRQVKKPERLIL